MARDQADKAYSYASLQAWILANDTYSFFDKQQADDQRVLAIFEARAYRIMKEPEYWSDQHESEYQRWLAEHIRVLKGPSWTTDIFRVGTELFLKISTFRKRVMSKFIG